MILKHIPRSIFSYRDAFSLFLIPNDLFLAQTRNFIPVDTCIVLPFINSSDTYQAEYCQYFKSQFLSLWILQHRNYPSIQLSGNPASKSSLWFSPSHQSQASPSVTKNQANVCPQHWLNMLLFTQECEWWHGPMRYKFCCILLSPHRASWPSWPF